ncbi:hypothetical protein [Streptomyces sp. NPDC059708]|uniref:hypothetical protein n=1 Tax=Streptomyces sp. NPDC059708 TaxID=3346916 RepID=UPI00368C71A8
MYLPDGDAFILDGHGTTLFPSQSAYTGSAARIRVHARGRDAAHDLRVVDDPVKEHLIQIWNAPVSGLVEYKLTDRVGPSRAEDFAVRAVFWRSVGSGG